MTKEDSIAMLPVLLTRQPPNKCENYILVQVTCLYIMSMRFVFGLSFNIEVPLKVIHGILHKMKLKAFLFFERIKFEGLEGGHLQEQPL